MENLPPYFHHIHTVSDAELWFEQIVAQSRLFRVVQKPSAATIGFLFAHAGSDQEAHIGYLLGEGYWGQGLASELLNGFIALAVNERLWNRLIAGVDPANRASAKLLTKLGFFEQPATASQVSVYEYPLR